MRRMNNWLSKMALGAKRNKAADLLIEAMESDENYCPWCLLNKGKLVKLKKVEAIPDEYWSRVPFPFEGKIRSVGDAFLRDMVTYRCEVCEARYTFHKRGER